MIPQHLSELLQHMEWADAATWRSVLALSEAREDADLHQRLHHLHLVQKAFLQIWQDQPMALSTADDFTHLDALRTWAQPYYGELTEYLETVDGAHLDQPVVLPWSEDLNRRYGKVHPTTLGQTMLQVTSHTTHHRGQVSARLRALGGEPPLCDYIAWLWQGQPPADWAE